MNIIIAQHNRFLDRELREFFEMSNDNVNLITDNEEDIIHALEKQQINKVYLNLDFISNTRLLHYINKNYSKTEVYIVSSPELYDIISTIKEGNFSLLKDPISPTKIA